MSGDLERIDGMLAELSRLAGTMEGLDQRNLEDAALAVSTVKTIRREAAGISGAFKDSLGSIEEAGASPGLIAEFKGNLEDIVTAARVLAIHFDVLARVLAWTESESPYEPHDKGLALFRESSELAGSVEPPELIPELYRSHQVLLEVLAQYGSIFSQLDEAKRSGDGRLVEEASGDLARLEDQRHLETIELFSLLDLVIQAQNCFDALKKEAGGG